MDTAVQPSPQFPHDLEYVAAHERVAETFGLTPSLLATGLFGAAAVYGIGAKAPEDALWIWAMVAGFILAGLGLIWYEIHRREQRVVFVLHDRQLAIYRGGLLSDVITPSQVVRYQLSVLNTIRYLLVPSVAALVLLAGGASDPRMLALGIFCLSIVGSMVWTRILCKHFYIPKGRRNEEVMLRSDDADMLLFPE